MSSAHTKRVESYFRQAIFLVKEYAGVVPFSAFIKHFFSEHKKFGSKDRKAITALCYSYFRLGQSVRSTGDEDRMKTAIFLCNPAVEGGPEILPQNLAEKIRLPVDEKIKFLSDIQPEFDALEIFAFAGTSDGIEKTAFSISHLIQPDLFIRLRPNKKEKVISALNRAAIPFEQIEDDCVALPNGVKLEEVLQINTDAVIQDLSSQNIKNFLEVIPTKNPLTIWDCCAGSGGKSILATDHLRVSALYVSDIRQSILTNLRSRLKEAGLKQPHIFEADLSKGPASLNTKFDLIICDVPCTGSGTWGRTPENLNHFKEEEIVRYNDLQRKIVTNASASLKKNGWLLYATCSVFRKENEDMVEFIEKTMQLRLIKCSVLKGYNKKADTLFGAIFQSDN